MHKSAKIAIAVLVVVFIVFFLIWPDVVFNNIQVLQQSVQGEPKPKIKLIDTQQESFNTIAVWVKNYSPELVDIQIKLIFYKNNVVVATKEEYVQLKANELKKVVIKMPSVAWQADRYEVFVRLIE